MRSRVDTEFLQRIHASLRGGVEHDFNHQFIDEHVRTCRPQPESGLYIEDESMLPQPNLSDWPPRQPIKHRPCPQENLQLEERNLLPGHIDFSQPSNIGAAALPLDRAATGNGSYDADLHNSQSSMLDFTGLTCHCSCHHHPQEPCFCFPDCSFYKAPTDALLG